MKAKSTLTLFTLAVLLAVVSSANAQTLQVLHTFEGTDGLGPGALAMDQAGNLYGAAVAGGTRNCLSPMQSGCGTVFELSKKNSSWAFATLYEFQDWTDGWEPNSPLTVGPDRIIYGTTYDHVQDQEGAFGTVFSLRPTCVDLRCKQAVWKKTTLYRFDRDHGGHGCYTNGGLALDKAGNLYGTTQRCFSGQGAQSGQVYELSPFRSLVGTWNMTVLHLFHGAPDDGKLPKGPVLFDQAGNLYGTTASGGSTDRGTVYELIPQGNRWTESLLHSFTGSDGEVPRGNLILDSSGSLYGVTQGGAFELTPSHDGWNITRQYVLRGPGYLLDGLTMDSAGNLYGVTVGGGSYGRGNVYKLTPTDDGWLYSSIYDFTGGSDGSDPSGPLVLDADGNLYGSAFGGGDANCNSGNGCGTVWIISTN